jgi:hypothetical protein
VVAGRHGGPPPLSPCGPTVELVMDDVPLSFDYDADDDSLLLAVTSQASVLHPHPPSLVGIQGLDLLPG